MKNIIVTMAAIFLVACSGNNPEKDKAEITDVIHKAYHYAAQHKYEEPLEYDYEMDRPFVKSADENHRVNYIKGMQLTGCFTEEFINKLDKVTAQVIKDLHDGTIVWNLEEDSLPIPSAEFDEWCMCMDPDEWLPYTEMKINFVSLSSKEATVQWYWDLKIEGVKPEKWPAYTIKLVNEDELWKINYMQGFDRKSYYP